MTHRSCLPSPPCLLQADVRGPPGPSPLGPPGLASTTFLGHCLVMTLFRAVFFVGERGARLNCMAFVFALEP